MATIGGVNSNGLNFSGLATGIDTDKIITGLTAINQRRIETLRDRQTDVVTQQSTFAALQAKLFDLQSKVNALARSVAGAFDGRTATSSDSSALTAAAGSGAVSGTYSLTVNALAQAHQTASQGFTDPNARIKEGTLTIKVGDGTATTVTIGPQNNTLQGLAEAINAGATDVRATVINDGSAAPYKLMLTSTLTGATNTISVTNNLTSGSGADINPVATTVQAAADAQVKLGTGAGAITVSSATNQVNGLISGVTLNLIKADPARPITLSVAHDTANAVKAVKEFVEAYNGVQEFINDRTKFEQESGEAGILLGNRDAAQLADDLAAAISISIPGLNQAANRLSSVGLSFGNDGKLVLDEGKLSQAVSGQTGATSADLKRLFGLTGVSDNPGVSFLVGTDRTRPTAGTPYQVQVTSPATRAVIVAGIAAGASIVMSPPNNTLLLKLNGLMSSEITLDSGTYTPEEVVAMIQQKINANAALKGHLVSVGLDGGGKIQITSQQYGSASKVEITGGTAWSVLGFAGNESATGTDVTGHFIANGQTETATGSGQLLTGADGNTNTSGLQVRATMNTPGSANVTVTQGLASRLSQVLNRYLDPVNGRFKTIDEGYKANIDDIEKTIVRQNEVLDEKTLQLQAQFAAMEAAVNQLKGLQNQFSSLLPTITPNNR